MKPKRSNLGFDVRIVRYEKIHKVKKKDYAALIRAIDPFAGAKIFEGCCGYGDVSHHIIGAFAKNKKKPDLYLMDKSRVQIERAKKEVGTMVKEIIFGNVKETRLKSDFFDRVVIKMGLHESLLREQKEIVKEVFRILKPGGKFIIWELSLNNTTQKIFQDVVRKKDSLAGFTELVKQRYFQKHDELVDLLLGNKFINIKDEHRIKYTFSTLGRRDELISRDKVEIVKKMKIISAKDEEYLEALANKKVEELNQYIRKRIVSKDDRSKVNFKDTKSDIRITIDKIIMSGEKPAA